MIQYKQFAWFPALALAGALATGCVVDDNGPVPPAAGTGLLTVLWTVDNTVDPDLCDYYGGGPTDFELLVYRGANLVVQDHAPCEDFGITVELRPGTYDGYATLVDPDDNPVTTTLPLDQLRITRDTELTVDIDFPPDSFLND